MTDLLDRIKKPLAIYDQVKKRVESRFYMPKPGGKPPAIKIIDTYQLPQPKYAPGDWVVWTVPSHESGGRSLVSRMARVSKVTQDRSWWPFTYHLRLAEPVEYTGGRRWAYDAHGDELSEPGAVDQLAQLAG